MTTIATALELVRARLNAALQAAAPRADDWVILSNLMDQDGRPVEATRNKMVMTLAQIAPDAAFRNLPDPKAPSPASARRLALVIAFVANFESERYGEGLAAIARTIRFLDETPVFANDDPSGPPLNLTITSVDLSETNALCDRLGVRYLPAVFYSLRNVTA